MNDTMTIDQVVAAFVERVRHQLRDLSDEERQELTEGLEADLADLVAERGPDALGEPAAYARELRSAAGLERRHGPVLHRPTSRGIEHLLDGAHDRWRRLAAALPWGAGELLETLRPVWWVLRAWVAVELIDFFFGSYPHGWVPRILGPVGWALTLVAVVISVQLGRGVLPLGPVRGLPRRIAFLVLNGFAILMLVPVVANLPQDRTDYYSSDVVPHLAFNGNQVQNVYPYDANGQPLTGVQLVDQDGQRLSVAGGPCLSYWTNGTKRVFSAFPVPSRSYDEQTGGCSGATTIDFPLGTLPPVSLPASVAAGTMP